MVREVSFPPSILVLFCYLCRYTKVLTLLFILLCAETTLGNNPRQSCESCDHRSVEDLAGLLIEKIWLALRGRYKADFVRPHKVAKMKSALLDALFSVPQNAFSLPFVADQVGEFVKGQLKHGNRPETVPAFQPKSPDGRALVKLFPRDERRGIARALIRKLDLSYRFHCVDPQCGTGCVFATHRCPNPGCTVTFSRKDWHEHDATCEYKEVPCVLQCGTMVSRVGMNMHISQQCVMRQVPCPYDRCGCRPSGKSHILQYDCTCCIPFVATGSSLIACVFSFSLRLLLTMCIFFL